MYVCLCRAVKESDVRRAIASGVEDVEALAEQLGVATGCGSCRDYAQALLEEHGTSPALPLALPAAG